MSETRADAAMSAVNKTLYIPLRGKAVVSRMGVLLSDPKAEEIWGREGFTLRGKSKSKWLAYFMGMRAAVFDDWVRGQLARYPGATVLHLGCGLDARALRVDAPSAAWYDVDMPDVIAVRRRYYNETERYRMLGASVTDGGWLDGISCAERAVVVMEGLSMYLARDELAALLQALRRRFCAANVLMDVYTDFAVKASRYANPIRDVGAGVVSGVDDPLALQGAGVRFSRRLCLTPPDKVNELQGFDRAFFRRVFAGKATDRLYRLYEYELAGEVTPHDP